MSSGHARTTASMNSQQLWLPTQDLHQRESTLDYGAGRGSRGLSCNWGVMEGMMASGKEESRFLLRLWLLVRWPSSGRWTYPQKYWESTNWSQWVMKTNTQIDSTREMAQQLRVCTALVEDPSSNPSIHNRKLFIISNSSYRGSNILFWPSWTPADTCKRPHVHIY